MKVYYANINDFDEGFFKKAIDVIPKEKREDISRFKNERAKKESLLGWYLFSFGAKEYAVQNEKICFLEKGKPYFANAGLHFNISHSDGFVCCAFSKSEVGIDAERPKTFSSSVIRRVLCENEKQVLEKSQNKEETFIRFWTLKESILKHSGEGITGGLLSLDFSPYVFQKSFEYKALNFVTVEIDDFLISICSKETQVQFIPLGVD